ncbi:nucleoside triphosphate pyrophosphohydrolase family protein [Candidatus Nomurabacteria bacterium]|nr:nucleoside triphosphate pyrophosphohydrolase family protein [Candidatus Nomurabacteria bacterium]
MKIEDYSRQAISTLLGDHDVVDMSPALISQVFGLVGESGEVAEKFKKLIRDKGGQLSDEDKQEILKELGDILWYINSVSNLLGSNLEEVAQKNLDKVLSRKARGVQTGSGDNR